MYRISLRPIMESPRVLHWQAKFAMTLIAIGCIGLFMTTQDVVPATGIVPFFLLVSALLGLLMLFLSVGINSSNSQLSETNQLVPEEMVEIIDPFYKRISQRVQLLIEKKK